MGTDSALTEIKAYWRSAATGGQEARLEYPRLLRVTDSPGTRILERLLDGGFPDIAEPPRWQLHRTLCFAALFCMTAWLVLAFAIRALI